MTIKKLTVAAAIAVGIATCSFSSAMAACPCNTNMPLSTGSNCATCPSLMTPACSTCPSCGLPSTSCTCGYQPACGCAPACAPACPAPCAKPACATCPNTSCDNLDMKQVYAYPNAIYGTNNYTGEQSNAIYSTESAWMLDCNSGLMGFGNGLTGAAAPLGYGYGYNTGAAAALGLGRCSSCNPVPCECGNPGVPVGRGCSQKCGCGCGCNTGAAAPMSDCGCLPIINVAPSCGCNTGFAAPMNNSGCGCGITIQTANSLNAIERSFAPLGCSSAASSACPTCSTGAASPLIGAFPDVPEGYWASCAIDRLACTNVVAGYPDRTFKPTLPVSRAEFASMMVKGFNLNLDCNCLTNQKLFKDVKCDHWANPVIAKAVQEGIMCGYPNSMFKPTLPVSRAEALTAMAHGINCDMDSCKAQSILSQYCDGNKVPDWAQIPVAKALQSGLLKDSPKPNAIDPCNDASRAEIASMLQTVRIAAGYDSIPTASKPDCDTACAAADDCGCAKKTTYMETEQLVAIPTLKVCFRDEINAKSSNVGDQFAANTSEAITINGKCYPKGSRVNGKIVEVVRPSGCQKGCLKVAFTDIQDCGGCKCELPRQILSAKVECAKTQNLFARLAAAPFTLVGGLVGTTGRTIGGMIASAGNAVEAVSGGVGIASSEILQGPCVWPAAGRSLQDAAKAAIMAPIDFTRTALSGTVGLFQTTGDEVAYLVDPNGTKISAINPKEKVTIAFGCH